jgi:hypothetical protein
VLDEEFDGMMRSMLELTMHDAKDATDAAA